MKVSRYQKVLVRAAKATLATLGAGLAALAVVTGVIPATAAAQATPMCNGEVATVVLADGDVATSGRDVIVGTASADTIRGYGGNDLICGLGGADTIDAGSGDDTVFGGGGHDVIVGGFGADVLYGQPGADTIRGGPGNDRLLGGTGFDHLHGDDGNDFVQGSGGDDELWGGDGDDAIYGKAGADRMRGDAGDDEIYSAGGNDLAWGGDGADRIQGAGGDDRLHGDGGDDVLYGQNNNDTMFGGDGDDELYGAAGGDVVFGDAGDDRLQGAGGDDALSGGTGRDILFGQAGSDILAGGPNTDFCYRGPGDLGACEGPATSLGGLEALWASARADIVEEITTAGWGVGSDNVLRGPAGYEVDLANCPSGWTDTTGVTSESVAIAQILAQSGSLAGYSAFGDGLAAYIDQVNASGGVGPDGLRIDLEFFDDEFVATRTQSIVALSLAVDPPFYMTNVGSPPAFAVQTMLNDSCVAQPFVASGHPAWGDAVNHPWTTGLQLSYAHEAAIWIEWIEQNLAHLAPVTVGAFVMDNDFGLAYEEPFTTLAEQSDIIGPVHVVRHDPAGQDFRNEFETLGSRNPDVVISMTAGNPCLLAMQQAEAAGLTTSAAALFTPSVCHDVAAYLLPAGDAADGWLSVGDGLKEPADQDESSDLYLRFVTDSLTAAGLDSANALHRLGFGLHGWTHVEALRIAAELPGGLTRTNHLLALRSLDLFHPMLSDGVAFEMNGTSDAFLIEGSAVQRYDATAAQWTPASPVIDLNGVLGSCAWQPGEGC